MASLINVHPPLNVHARPMGVVATTHRTKHTADAARARAVSWRASVARANGWPLVRSVATERGHFELQDTGTQAYRKKGFGDMGI